ncbi:snf2 family helicase [Fusarium austroafricanum]|uniref:Snf2 family helicase n=1 Tax=Fusarium austroafricanum TaxID=2364996 RepID=A0A8H4KNH2_9HYPO|nr:snf2 family helicase [Fusarium austroafricanum]
MGSNVVKPLLGQIYTRRTIRTGLRLPGGKIVFPSESMLPVMVSVEEFWYPEVDSLAPKVKEAGKMYADNLFVLSEDSLQERSQNINQPDFSQDSSQEAHMNFGEHRAGVITTFDPRTIPMLRGEKPAFHVDKVALINAFSELANELPLTSSRKRNQAAIASGGLGLGRGVSHLHKLINETENGALHYIYDCNQVDPDLPAPTDRSSFVRWLCAKSPTFVRALQHLEFFVGEQNKRALLVVDTPWIQIFVVSTLTHFGYNVATVPAEDSNADRIYILDQWNDSSVPLNCFVANVNTMSVDVNLYHACQIGLVLNWHLSATVMEQHMFRLHRLGKEEIVKWFLLKTANSYHDNLERLVVQRWMVTASTQCGLPGWLQYESLEICLCEVMNEEWKH